MLKFFHYFIIIMVCGCMYACGKKELPNKISTADSTTKDYCKDYIPHDFIASENDSTARVVKEIVCDTSKWWCMPIVHTNTEDHLRKLEADSIKIEIAKDWCRNHPDKCNDYVVGKIWSKQGKNKILTGDWDLAVSSLEKAYLQFSKTEAYLETTNLCINLAGTYYRSGKIAEAMEFYRRAAFIEDSLRVKTHYVAIQTGIAQAYTDLQNYIIAHQYLDNAKKYLKKAHISELYYYYITRGVCYYYQKKFKMAYASFTVALEYAKNIGLYQEIMCEASLGETALMDNDIELALTHIDDCVKFLKENSMMKNKTLKFYIVSLSADVYMSYGETAKAQQLLEELPSPHEVKMMRYLSLHYQRLTTYAVQNHNYKKAYEMLQVAHRYTDSISNLASINTVIEIGRRYQRDTTLLQQRYMIANLEAKTSHHHMRLIVLVGSLLIITLTSFIAMKMVRRRNEKRIQTQFEQISKLRMDVVRNRLSPHFVFNVLGMMLPKFKQNPDLHQLSELFIDVLRGNLLASNELSILYKEEVRLVKQYVGLYHKVKGNLPIVNWHDATNEEADQLYVPTTCILIPIENALKHAFPELKEGDSIDIYTMCEDNRLMIRVIDNGVGYHPGRVAATGRDTGTGLRVLSRTIALLNLKNSHPIEFQVRNLNKDGNKGTEVKISIPFEYQYKL